MPFRMERRTTGKASLAPTHPSQRREGAQQHAVFASEREGGPGAFAISRQNYRHQNPNEDPDWDPTYQEPTLAEEPDPTASMAGDTALTSAHYDDNTTVAEVTVAGTKKPIMRKRRYLWAITAAVLIAGIVMAVVIGMKGPSGGDDNGLPQFKDYISCSDLYPVTDSSEIENYGVLVAELGVDPPPVTSCKPINEALLFVAQDYNRLSTLSRLDRFVLATLYASTDGGQWRDSSGWMTGAPACDWYGVSCRDGIVTGINLVFNKLQGTLPKEMGRLTSLEALVLDENDIEGTIPSSMESMTNLVWLDLERNRIEGSPLNFLVRMPWIVTLNLSFNPITGTIPVEIGSMTALTELYLLNNDMSGEIPETLQEIGTLKLLRLGENRINGTLPEPLFHMAGLESLDISGTEVEGTLLPASISQMSNLATLILKQNMFVTGTIPTEIGLLTDLAAADLSSQMSLTGTIPESLGALSNLVRLTLAETGLTGTLPFGVCENVNDRFAIVTPCDVECHHCCVKDALCEPVIEDIGHR